MRRKEKEKGRKKIKIGRETKGRKGTETITKEGREGKGMKGEEGYEKKKKGGREEKG